MSVLAALQQRHGLGAGRGVTQLAAQRPAEFA